MERILITGKNSYIGNELEKYLVKNFQLYDVDQVDLRDKELEEIKFERYTTVFHVAGIAHQKETESNKEIYYSVNRDLAVSVATMAKEQGVRHFIFMSTMSVYGEISGIIDSKTQLNPVTHYGKSKLEAEISLKELEAEDFLVAILRPPMVYGKGCKGNYPRLSSFVNRYKVFPEINNKRSMIYIENLVSSIELIIKHRLSGLFCPQNDEYVCTTDLAKLIGNVNNIKVTIIPNVFNIFGILSVVSNTFNKLVGNLSYDTKLSEIYSSQGEKLVYNVIDFDTGIRETESE